MKPAASRNSCDSARFERAIARFDTLNAEDPALETVQGREVPGELLYAQRMSERLVQFAPEASEALCLAARCQHIQRWKIPRSDYPMNRPGYKRWRLDLAAMHAQIADQVLEEAGYQQDIRDRVGMMLRKEKLKRDDEVQCLEDVICLVFLEHYFTAFAAKHAREKIISIVRKTWNKMSAQGHAAALRLPLGETELALVEAALQPDAPDAGA